MAMSNAEQIAELHALKEKGALTDEEFANAKEKLLGTLSGATNNSNDLGNTMFAAASSVGNAISESLKESPSGYSKLLWGLYAASLLSNLLLLVPGWAFLGILLAVGVVVAAMLKSKPASGTFYSSHFRNVVSITVVSQITGIVFIMFVIATMGLGLIAGPIALAIMAWYIYRLVKGMLRLSESKEI